MVKFDKKHIPYDQIDQQENNEFVFLQNVTLSQKTAKRAALPKMYRNINQRWVMAVILNCTCVPSASKIFI